MFYDLCIYFFIYGFLGWVVEVSFHAIAQHKLVNRGFLNGAICPIYGFGMVLLIVLTEPFRDNIFLLFVGSVIICSLLELATGFVLEKIYHHRWWDYSNEKFNLGGYICLSFSLCWGVAGVIAIKIIHSGISDLVGVLPMLAQEIVAWVLIAIMFVDQIATAINVRGLNKELTHIDELGDSIRKVSDELTKMIYDESLSVKDKYEDKKPEIEQKKKELEQKKAELQKRMETIPKSLSFGQRRLIKAFPSIRSISHSETMEQIKEKLLK